MVAHAQQTGSIVDTVHDPSGALVPNASVKITNTNTQFQRVVKTDASGEHVAPPMPTGTDAITVAVIDDFDCRVSPRHAIALVVMSAYVSQRSW